MRFRRAAQVLPAIETPEQHAENAEEMRKMRNGLIIGGLALIGVSAGIDIMNGPETAERIVDLWPYLPGVVGGGMLICVPGAHIMISEELKQSRPGSDESFI